MAIQSLVIIEPERLKAAKYLKILALFIFFLVVWGSMVRVTQSGLSIPDWPMIFDRWIPIVSKLFQAEYANPISNFLFNQILIQLTHRWFAFIFLGAFVGLWLELKNMIMHPRTKRALEVAAGLILLQIILGIINILLGVPKIITLLHPANTMAVFTVLVIVLHDIFVGVVKRVR